MLRAARKASGNATSAPSSVPRKAITSVCSSLIDDVAMLPLRVVPEIVEARAASSARPASRSGPAAISARSSPADLPKNGEFGSKMKLGQPRKRLRTLTRSAATRTSPEKP